VTLVVKPGELAADDLRDAYRRHISITLDPACLPGIADARKVVATVVAEDRTVYGINTGFGLLANKRIPFDELEELQRRLVLSHACGVGEPLPDEQVRLVMLLKIASLARGHSGVRQVLIDALISLFNAGVYPRIPSQGSVGASGDLAPLAHLSLPLIGEGEVRYQGNWLAAKEGLAHAGLSPMRLAPKEGLALLNGTQVSTAMALAALFETERVFNAAVIAGALSVDAALGSDAPFDDRIHRARGHSGQQKIAMNLFDELGTDLLRPVYDELDGKVSYNDLQILRLLAMNNEVLKNK
jgi:histidine ammonia-lyase